MAEAAKGKIAALGQRVARFFREVRAELKKVIWPGRAEITTFTAVVLISVTIVAALIWVVDSAVARLLILLIR
ncbi:MAG: preprotein translocase subunit SecE [Firmicutes bacterium]|nr:preprotein translocase subunit SecE [Bacillota bacterium]